MGSDLFLGRSDSPLPPAVGTDMPGALERLVHIEELRSDICALHCGTMNFAVPTASTLKPQGCWELHA